MKRKLIARLFLICCLAIFVAGCGNSKKLSYFQDISDTTKISNVPLYPYVPVKLQVDDELQILVTSSSPEASQFFNISSSTSITSSSASINSYRVTPNGYITLPIIGDMQVLGLTTQEVKLKVAEALKPYLKDAVISVRILNFKVTVIGEVQSPIVVPVTGERINVLEAIGAAGDMTIFSKRFNVKILRRTKDGMEIAHLNFNNTNMMQSPFFQLQQNDVIYVEPEKTKGIGAERLTIFLPIIISITSLVITVVNLLTR
jgi:polysaccharide export outer membrane protein